MEIKWLRKALESLNNELDYISQDDPAAAQKILERIHKTVLSLADNPSAGRAGRVSGTRELVVPNTRCLVPYRVRLDLKRVEILRVFHCSRRPPENW
ncbi:type II toxin-antitoxin system RelE/ParE family toxin [Endozoicomonas sp. 8E]|uniref:type II toxin-antitoxin system RelE/ParE family toxin n=1 Tax=Endozoicomonas sp. 8E TaxID=3035692 RepID=UPI003977D0FF